ncbi:MULTISPECIES: response regulator [unclassified Coleofasciculus]|uniref:hybrid sensor histidine kinase/response regulator n=1 Tax=unclassified Coleofasciculus TaxID=2692782 RepID=UPI00187EA914|nr:MULTISPECIES: response regulator [unclassified Coleofasciculus]MBE9128689.1 response regulator [Coleofasciculus sp. LEGE 07081]MBE9151475.1 response regulator [Coleofasciculus sp. LEGE 07092]
MKTILIIEDEEYVREIICEILKAENFEVFDAENGRIGVQLAEEKQPDLIICDVMMPELDGYGVIDQLRQNPATEAIPFIFLTARADKSDLRYGMELGADDYLTKPFTQDELLGAIAARQGKQAIANRQSQQRVNELRDHLTHSLPHELNTPLNGILGLAQLLINDYDSMDRDEALEMLESIHASGRRLYRLTQNFLLYADLELIATDSEQVKALQRSEVTCQSQPLIREVAFQKAQQVHREGDLRLDLPGAVVRISESKLRKIVEELVDNAFKFSIPNTPVILLGQCQDCTFDLSVINVGRGMTAEQIASLGAYRQFKRKLYEQQGSGLGLAIAKRLTELQGGRLTIESIPDQKTIVRVILPVSAFPC